MQRSELMFERMFRIVCLLGLLLTASPGSAQPTTTASAVLDVLGFDREYPTYVEEVITGMTSAGQTGSPDVTAKNVSKLQADTRRFLLDKRSEVRAILERSLSAHRSEAELQGLLEALASGETLDDLPPQVGYSLRAEIFAAASGLAAETAVGDAAR